MKEKQTTKPQTKLPVDREAVRVLAIELGAREAARRVGVNESTVLSWARRDKWKLPKRTGGATKASASAITLRSKPGDVLIASHEELAERSRTAILQAGTKAAEAARDAEALPVKDVQQLQQLTSALARVLGWGASAPSVNYYGDVNTVVVCDQKRRAELIEQRQRLLEAEATGKVIELNGKRDGEAVGRKTAAAAPVAIPEPETQPDANVSTENGTVAQEQDPTPKQDPLSQWRESIRTAATWKGNFGTYPEEEIY